MKFIDMVNIYVVAGKGGDGIISFRREKFIPKGGPDGGNGGSGGNIWLKTSNNLNTLVNFNFKKIFFSQSGKNGNNNNKTGKNGKDLYIIVPIGTRVIDQNKNKTIINLLYNKQLFLLAKGGKPGIGNNKFKNSINRTPMKRTLGLKGEKKNIKLELFLLANVGTLGLPNAGKSTFINIISSAKSKISCYPFTTLSPKLGLVKFNKKKKFIIADIPGIIKNCSKGIGLGINFLKHLTHCNLLLHIIDISSQNINIIIKNIINIQNELKNYNYNLYKKKRWLIFNKIDLINNKNFIKLSFKIINKLNWNNKHFIISSKKNFGINELCFNIIKKIYKKNEKKKNYKYYDITRCRKIKTKT
ncbi:GTPase Obg [Candidatus Annandia adelgestsuga]|uniref:GTPase Obg n=1 Tax=Candidatus Annandia adelgestsuga TaxID=1302411 RepID=A0A3S9J7T9_9ENTR|nr:GTPase ObgE [Candidatus Annandia adelgestsuga]AZP36302.1 GTPase Obg [Candidatus Annandia adelgestsuga]